MGLNVLVWINFIHRVLLACLVTLLVKPAQKVLLAHLVILENLILVLVVVVYVLQHTLILVELVLCAIKHAKLVQVLQQVALPAILQILEYFREHSVHAFPDIIMFILQLLNANCVITVVSPVVIILIMAV